MFSSSRLDVEKDFGDFNFDLRSFKRAHEDFDHFQDKFSPYAERLKRRVGIENDMALKLLHKTQSAKNLGDLNQFMREFMLDRPDTFDLAQSMVRSLENSRKLINWSCRPSDRSKPHASSKATRRVIWPAG